MITITQDDLIEYRNKTYMLQYLGTGRNFIVDSGSVETPDSAPKLASDTTKSASDIPNDDTTTSLDEPVKTTFSIDELQADAEEFENRINSTLEQSLQDQKVSQYLSFQKAHKQNFLEEVRKKGLTIAGPHRQKSAERKPPMNY